MNDRLIDVENVLYDVAGYLISLPFPPKYSTLGAYGMALALAISELREIQGKWLFRIVVTSENGISEEVSKEEACAIVDEIIRLHKKGYRDYLDNTPRGVLDVFMQFYADDSIAKEEKPIKVIQTEPLYPFDVKVKIYPWREQQPIKFKSYDELCGKFENQLNQKQ